MSGAERQCRHMVRLKAGQMVLDFVTDEPAATLSRHGPVMSVTDENSGHRALFAIPQATPSDSTALMVRTLPEVEAVTGDREVDAVLWLGKICQCAIDPAALDRAVGVASRIKTPAKELENANGGCPAGGIDRPRISR